MQETETLVLPVTKKEVLIRGYVTGLIDREVRAAEGEANKVSYEVDPEKVNKQNPNETPEAKMILTTDTALALKAEELLLQRMVLAIDGDTGDVYNKLLELPAGDVRFVTERVNALRRDGEVAAADPKAQTNSVQS